MPTAREKIFGAVHGRDCRDAVTAGEVADLIVDRLAEEVVVSLRADVKALKGQIAALRQEVSSMKRERSIRQ